MKYLTKQQFDKKALEIGGKHWETYKERWEYHRLTANLLKDIEFNAETSNVLEIGSMGIKIIEESDELDFDMKAVWPTFNPKYYHDLRVFPYPIKDKQYDVVVCLRVLHHLHGKQKQIFDEFRRIGKKVVMAIPHAKYGEEDVVEWAGKEPTLIMKCKQTPTHIYYWENI